MNKVKPIIVSQYRASLAMFREAMEKCPKALWADAQHNPPFWRIAYHTLFYTDLYLSEKRSSFTPWVKHIEKYQKLDPLVPIEGAPYSKADLLAYESLIGDKLDEVIGQLELGAESGFSWLPFTKLELQFYNIRHIHHHAGQLSIWLREESKKEISWVATVLGEK